MATSVQSKAVQSLGPDRHPSDINLADLKKYLTSLHTGRRPLSNDSSNNHLILLARLWNWPVAHGHATHNPVLATHRIPSSRALGVARDSYLDDQTLAKLLAAAKADGNPRLWPIKNRASARLRNGSRFSSSSRSLPSKLST
jgi:site-specific recombinase XerD